MRALALGRFPLADAADVDAAMRAAHAACPGWRETPHAERARLVRRVGEIMEQRVYEIAAALSLEVGKNRMEALGEAQETVEFYTGYADELERNQGYDRPLPDDPLEGAVSHNRSVMRPYGVWAVIAPFNFPLALAGGPAAAAMVTGNTVVLKGASDTPWAGRLLADCVRDAGLPPGVFNYLSGSRRAGRRGAGRASPRRRHHLHRFGRGRHAPGAADGLGRVPAALHRRDGRQESLHRHRARRPRSRRGRHPALGLRHGRAEVLGAVAALRARARRRCPDRQAQAADGCGPDRRPDEARALARAR